MLTHSGASDISQRHHTPTADHRVPVRSYRLQRRNGGHRSSRKGCITRKHGQPYASSTDDSTARRPKRTKFARNDHGRKAEETLDRVKRIKRNGTRVAFETAVREIIKSGVMAIEGRKG